MSLVKWAIIALVALPVAEITLFIVVAAAIGWFWATALLLATSMAGAVVLRISGKSELNRFVTAVADDGLRQIHLETPGLGWIVGGILLVFPGFITDLLGALLFIPTVRRWASVAVGKIVRARRRESPDRSVIDLTPEEWHQVSDRSLEHGSKRKRPRKRALEK